MFGCFGFFRYSISVMQQRVLYSAKTSREFFALKWAQEPSPSFSTRGICNAGRRSKSTSWLKGLYHRSDVSVLIQKLPARANAGWRLGRQCGLELFEQDFMIGLWMGIAAESQGLAVGMGRKTVRRAWIGTGRRRANMAGLVDRRHGSVSAEGVI